MTSRQDRRARKKARKPHPLTIRCERCGHVQRFRSTIDEDGNRPIPCERCPHLYATTISPIRLDDTPQTR